MIARLSKGAHVVVQGKLATREYDRTIQVFRREEDHRARHPAAYRRTEG